MKTLHRMLPAVAIAGLMLIASVGQSETLILKRADGSTITSFPLTTSNGCTVTPAGDIEVRPQSDTACSGGTAPTAPVFTTALTITPTTVVVGGNVTATWATTGATSCSNTGTILPAGANVPEWTASLATSNTSGLVMTLSTVGSYTFVIACTNTTGTTTSQRSVTVNAGGACAGVVPIGGLTLQTSFTNATALTGNEEWPNGPITVTTLLPFYEGHNPSIGTPFPSRVGAGTLAVLPGKYMALKFNPGTFSTANYGTGANNHYGTFTIGTPTAGIGQVLAVISECPGEFTALPANNLHCRTQTGDGGITWVVAATNNNVCRLQENTDYYLNVAYVDFNAPTVSTCGSPDAANTSNPGSCHFFMRPMGL